MFEGQITQYHHRLNRILTKPYLLQVLLAWGTLRNEVYHTLLPTHHYQKFLGYKIQMYKVYMHINDQL